MRCAAMLLVLFACLAQTGCVRIAKQGIAEIRGANARVIAVSDYHPSQLASYRSVEFEPVGTTLTPRVLPPEVVPAFDAGYRRAAAKDDFLEAFPGGGPTLRVSTDVQYFHKKGILDDAMCIARVRLRDGARNVADLIVRVTSTSFREGDADDLAMVAARELAEFLVKRPREAKP